MALVKTQSNSTENSTGTATATATVTLPSVTAGRLIGVFLKYEGASTTSTLSDGLGSTVVPKTQISHANGDMHGRWFYILASVGSGSTVTFTVTFGASRPYWRVHVYEFSYSGTASLDVEPSGGGATGTSTAVNSGNMTTTGTDEVVLAGYGEYSAETFSNPLVNAVAASGSIINSPAGSFAASWYRILTATFAGGAATGTISDAREWVCVAIAIKVAAGGGGGGVVGPLIGGRLAGRGHLTKPRLIGRSPAIRARLAA